MNPIGSLRSHTKTIWRDILSDPLNNGRKFRFLFNYFYWQAYAKFRSTWKIKFENGMTSLVRPVPDNDSGEIGIWTRNVDYYDTWFVRSVLSPGDYAIDAGCNVGNRTIALADLLDGALLIDAGKEAVKRTREHIEMNELSSNDFIVLHKAVGDKPGIVTFTDEGGASTVNRVVEAGDASVKTIQVEMTTIDQEVEKWGHVPTYIKIDVEGQDYNVLQGSRKTLETGKVKLVKFERNRTEALEPFIQFFGGMGWKIFTLDKRGRVNDETEKIRKSMNLFAMPIALYERRGKRP